MNESEAVQFERMREALEAILRVAPLVISPNNPTYDSYECNCCRSKDAYARRALGIKVRTA